jgi:hypothetical protein
MNLPPPASDNSRTARGVMDYEQQRAQYSAPADDFFGEPEWVENQQTVADILGETHPDVPPETVVRFVRERMAYPIHVRAQREFRTRFRDMFTYNTHMIGEFDEFLTAAQSAAPAPALPEQEAPDRTSRGGDEMQRRLAEMESDLRTLGGTLRPVPQVDFRDKASEDSVKRVSFEALLEERKRDDEALSAKANNKSGAPAPSAQPLPPSAPLPTIPEAAAFSLETGSLEETLREAESEVLLAEREIAAGVSLDVSSAERSGSDDGVDERTPESPTSPHAPSQEELPPEPSHPDNPDRGQGGGHLPLKAIVTAMQRGHAFQRDMLAEMRRLAAAQGAQYEATTRAIQSLLKQQQSHLSGTRSTVEQQKMQFDQIMKYMNAQFNTKQELDAMKRELVTERQHLQRTIGTYVPNQTLTLPLACSFSRDGGAGSGPAFEYTVDIGRDAHRIQVPASAVVYVKAVHIPLIRLEHDLPEGAATVSQMADTFDMLEFEVEHECEWRRAGSSDARSGRREAGKSRVTAYRREVGFRNVTFGLNLALEKQSPFEAGTLSRAENMAETELAAVRLRVRAVSPFDEDCFSRLHARRRVFGVMDAAAVQTNPSVFRPTRDMRVILLADLREKSADGNSDGGNIFSAAGGIAGPPYFAAGDRVVVERDGAPAEAEPISLRVLSTATLTPDFSIGPLNPRDGGNCVLVDDQENRVSKLEMREGEPLFLRNASHVPRALVEFH